MTKPQNDQQVVEYVSTELWRMACKGKVKLEYTQNNRRKPMDIFESEEETIHGG